VYITAEGNRAFDGRGEASPAVPRSTAADEIGLIETRYGSGTVESRNIVFQGSGENKP
jgi:hypothetical protein